MENIFIPTTQETASRPMKENGDVYHIFDEKGTVHHEYAPKGQNVNQHIF
jgi:hypothetical protein